MASSKKSGDLDYYFGVFLKDLMYIYIYIYIYSTTTLLQSFIARAELVQDLWSVI